MTKKWLNIFHYYFYLVIYIVTYLFIGFFLYLFSDLNSPIYNFEFLANLHYIEYIKYYELLTQLIVAGGFMEYNLYCDESNHLFSNDGSYMIIGSLSCPKNKVKKINKYLTHLKETYKIDNNMISNNEELKWNKVGKKNLELYLDVIKYFFSNDDLRYRAIVINKSLINNKKYNQTDDEFYHKMYYVMLQHIISPGNTFNIYPDIKDTNSYHNHQILLDILRKKFRDTNNKTLKKNQPIRSHQVMLLQLTDILTGALGYYYRNLNTSPNKLKVIEEIKEVYPYNLNDSTPFNYSKFNVLIWRSKDDINKD